MYTELSGYVRHPGRIGSTNRRSHNNSSAKPQPAMRNENLLPAKHAKHAKGDLGFSCVSRVSRAITFHRSAVSSDFSLAVRIAEPGAAPNSAQRFPFNLLRRFES